MGPAVNLVPKTPPRALDAVGSSAARNTAAESSFAAIYEQHVRFAWRQARLMGVQESAVADIVQEVFLVVHRRMADFDGRSSMQAWVRGILRGVVRNYHRGLRRHPTSPLTAEDALEGPDRPPSRVAIRNQAIEIFESLLLQIDPEKREIFVFSEIEGLTAARIAELTGLNANTVYSRLRAARKQFESAAADFRKAEQERGQ